MQVYHNPVPVCGSVLLKMFQCSEEYYRNFPVIPVLFYLRRSLLSPLARFPVQSVLPFYIPSHNALLKSGQFHNLFSSGADLHYPVSTADDTPHAKSSSGMAHDFLWSQDHQSVLQYKPPSGLKPVVLFLKCS